MNIVYTWKIDLMKTMTINERNNTVFQVNWTLFGTDEDSDKMCAISETTEINTNEINEEDFVEYEDLTEEIVIGWLESTLGNEMQRRKDQIVVSIEKAIRNDITSTPALPWVTVAPE